ncbi:MAG: GNAT family N-acetyltransferase [Sphingosinicella sp.]
MTTGGSLQSIPVLETERLELRGFCAADLEPQAQMMADPEVVRHLGGLPFAREDSWRRLLAAPGLWSILGYGYWAVERRKDGRLLGQVGFADFKRAMTPSIEGLPEMGWIFSRHAQGQGYASEAAAAALAWADAHLSQEEIVAIIEPGNHASIRLAERIGFQSSEEACYRDGTVLLLRRRAVTVSA